MLQGSMRVRDQRATAGELIVVVNAIHCIGCICYHTGEEGAGHQGGRLSSMLCIALPAAAAASSSDGSLLVPWAAAAAVCLCLPLPASAISEMLLQQPELFLLTAYLRCAHLLDTTKLGSLYMQCFSAEHNATTTRVQAYSATAHDADSTGLLKLLLTCFSVLCR